MKPDYNKELLVDEFLAACAKLYKLREDTNLHGDSERRFTDRSLAGRKMDDAWYRLQHYLREHDVDLRMVATPPTTQQPR